MFVRNTNNCCAERVEILKAILRCYARLYGIAASFEYILSNNRVTSTKLLTWANTLKYLDKSATSSFRSVLKSSFNPSRYPRGNFSESLLPVFRQVLQALFPYLHDVKLKKKKNVGSKPTKPTKKTNRFYTETRTPISYNTALLMISPFTINIFLCSFHDHERALDLRQLIPNEGVARFGYNHLISKNCEWNNSFCK